MESSSAVAKMPVSEVKEFLPPDTDHKASAQRLASILFPSTDRATMSPTADKASPYELLYWPGIPGRGEFIRLVFEAASVSYKDVSNEENGGKPNNQNSAAEVFRVLPKQR
jgi:hypothetical protein